MNLPCSARRDSIERVYPRQMEKSALPVIDLQNDFVSEGAIMEVPEARRQIPIPRVKRLIECCRRLGVPVIYTIHAHHPEANEVNMFPRLRSEGLREGTTGVEVYSEIKPLPGEIVIKKRRYSAFYNSGARNAHGLGIPLPPPQWSLPPCTWLPS